MKISCTLSLFILFVWSAHAQHGHLEVGARGWNQNDPLVFDNGSVFMDTNGYIKTLVFTNAGRFAGYYEGNITLTALSSTLAANSPAPGSFIQFALSNISGPPGGAFSFWDAGTVEPTVSLLPGQGSPGLYVLSESDGSPGSDPHGHIHGRRFTATHPGIYKVAFRAFDTSTNGAGGGPIHTPTAWLPVYFQAGVNIQSLTNKNNSVTIRYGARAGTTATLEYTTDLSQATWLPTGPPEIGQDDHFQTIQDLFPVDDQRFYRLRIDPIPEEN